MQNILKNIALNGTKRGKKMSREIKFRIWDKINRMWLRCFNVNLFDIGDLPNVELMQYTGVKDKNGKEIYENDLISCNKYKNIVVFFENGCFKVKYSKNDTTNVTCTLDTFLEKYKCKISGNVYENKNLLEENK